MAEAKKHIGKAKMQDVIDKFKAWVDEADLDDLASVIGHASGTYIEIHGDEESDVAVFESEDGYCGMFDGVIVEEALAMCGECTYKSGETMFHVIEDYKWLGDLKCPMCGSENITVADPTL